MLNNKDFRSEVKKKNSKIDSETLKYKLGVIILL